MSTTQAASSHQASGSGRSRSRVVTKLKAERIQDAFTAVAEPASRLKTGQVQEGLRLLPAWRMARGGKGIERVRRFPSSGIARAYALFVSEFAAHEQQSLKIAVSAGEVVLTLRGRPVEGFTGLTPESLAFAADLE